MIKAVDMLLSISFEDLNFWWLFTINMILIFYIIKKCFTCIKPYKHLTDFPSNYHEMVIEARVVKVPDGDGFEFIHRPKFYFGDISKFTPLRARLAGIDAPEGNKDEQLQQPLSKESQLYLKYLILNKDVTIKILDIDKFFRLLVIVWIDGIIANLEMVKTGYAVIYRENHAMYDNYFKMFNNAESFAKRRLNGFWNLENSELPGDYKKRINLISKKQ